MEEKIGFICDDCKTIEFGESNLADKSCPQCKKQRRTSKLREVQNTERLTFLGIVAAPSIPCFIIGSVLNNSRPDTALGFFVFGGIFLFIPIIYLWVALFGKSSIGFGGWSWLTKKYELDNPPSWYKIPSKKQALFNEAKVSIYVIIAFVAFGLFVKMCTALTN